MSSVDSETEQIAGRLLAYLRRQFNDHCLRYDSPLTRLRGGYVTSIYRFGLNGLKEVLNRPLVLRLYPEHDAPENAVRESCVQNALAALGCPVARVYHVCTDKSILGGAFLVMDFLPGELLITAPVERIPEILGRAHAALHREDPQALVTALTNQGLAEGPGGANGRPVGEASAANEFPWIRDGVDWLVAHRPPESEALAICHGDFHPLNLLVQDGAVTGVLDWSDCLVAEPAWDIANTILRLTMPFEYLVSPRLGSAFASVDWDEMAQTYVDAYRQQSPSGTANLEYYRARQSIYALVEGVRGHPVWRYPPIVRDLIGLVQQTTGVRITMPDQEVPE
jgi:aminoglycoside phosphotransferase (APT) family kinase protein